MANSEHSSELLLIRSYMRREQRFINRRFNANQVYLYFWLTYHCCVVKHTYANGWDCIARFSCNRKLQLTLVTVVLLTDVPYEDIPVRRDK